MPAHLPTQSYRSFAMRKHFQTAAGYSRFAGWSAATAAQLLADPAATEVFEADHCTNQFRAADSYAPAPTARARGWAYSAPRAAPARPAGARYFHRSIPVQPY